MWQQALPPDGAIAGSGLLSMPGGHAQGAEYGTHSDCREPEHALRRSFRCGDRLEPIAVFLLKTIRA